VLLEPTFVRVAWTFNFDVTHYEMAGVIWVIGWCMILLAGLVRLPRGALARWIGLVGRVPFFFYMLHIPLIHTLPRVRGFQGEEERLAVGLPVTIPPLPPPAVANVLVPPHPAWFRVAAILVLLAGTFLGARMASGGEASRGRRVA